MIIGLFAISSGQYALNLLAGRHISGGAKPILFAGIDITRLWSTGTNMASGSTTSSIDQRCMAELSYFYRSFQVERLRLVAHLTAAHSIRFR
jgi:hypothetical protein